MNILIINNNETITTSYGFYHSIFIRNYAESLGYGVCMVTNPDLPTFEKALETCNPHVIIFFGTHGGSRSIIGQDHHVILGVDGYDEEIETRIYGSNIHLLQDKIIFSLTCWSGKKLGKELVKAGAKAFIGYEKPFFFISASLTPSWDDKAEPFFRCNVNGLKLMLSGETLENVYKYTKNCLISEATNYLEKDKDVAKYLIYDATGLVIYGNKYIKLSL